MHQLTNTVESGLDPKTEALNQSGTFLQIHIVNQLKKQKWGILFEYPVLISPFANPTQDSEYLKNMMQGLNMPAELQLIKRIKESLDKTRITETSIDIVAGKQHSDFHVTLCIEAKKLDPRYINWVFFKISNTQTKLRYFKRSNHSSLPILFATPQLDKMPATYLTMAEHKEFNYPICDFGLSIKDKKMDNDYYKSEKTIVDKSAHQIIQGHYAFMIEQILGSIIRKEPNLRHDGAEHFFPIIVTNAKLYLCKNYNELINPESGTLEENPTFEKVKGIVYECPIPQTVCFPDPAEEDIRTNNDLTRRKWHILIINPCEIDKLLETLSKVS